MLLKSSIGKKTNLIKYFLRYSNLYFRYCARLPCDALTTLVPSCEIKKLNPEQYQCILSLPVNSPARTTIIVKKFIIY